MTEDKCKSTHQFGDRSLGDLAGCVLESDHVDRTHIDVEGRWWMLSAVQPLPTKNDYPAIVDLVLEDIRTRDKIGMERYGTRLQPHNGRDALRDAYEEALDLAIYLRQVIEERGR